MKHSTLPKFNVNNPALPWNPGSPSHPLNIVRTTKAREAMDGARSTPVSGDMRTVFLVGFIAIILFAAVVFAHTKRQQARMKREMDNDWLETGLPNNRYLA